MIGIFDSGFGGLTIFKEIEKTLPDYNYVYLGDNDRAPYGNSSQAVIFNQTKQAVDYLFNQGCFLIILACHTASAEALRKIQQEYLPSKWPGKNVLGVIRPLAEEASQLSNNKSIVVLGTNSTVESGAYIRELKEQDKALETVQRACPLLVPIVENSKEANPATKEILKEYIRELKGYQPDTVILGCTHYGWLTEQIQQEFGNQVLILNSGSVVANKLKNYLQRHSNMVKLAGSEVKRTFLTTGDSHIFDSAAEKFLGRIITSKKINLNEYE